MKRGEPRKRSSATQEKRKDATEKKRKRKNDRERSEDALKKSENVRDAVFREIEDVIAESDGVHREFPRSLSLFS